MKSHLKMKVVLILLAGVTLGAVRLQAVAEPVHAVGPIEPPREETRKVLIDDVARSWKPPETTATHAEVVSPAAAVGPIVAKLNEIVLPTVSFTRVPIGQVVAALGAAAEQFDQAATLPKGINLVLLDPENRAPTVTICNPITSRCSSSTSRKKSAMQWPSPCGWRGSVKRQSSVLPSGSNTISSLPWPAAFQ